MMIPDVIFIIPYRDRENEKNIFITKMNIILEKTNLKYKFFFIHQVDNRDFNRGAMKNIGFLIVKDMYPNDYQTITLCFNDIDTYPNNDIAKFDYSTKKGIVKHFYGYQFALHGIVSINCLDFEMINGYPNYWSWGFEDNMLYDRVVEYGLQIDRSVFYPIGNNNDNIVQINNNYERIVNEGEFERFLKKINEGIYSIMNLKYIVNDDNMIHVMNFDTEYVCNTKLNKVYDIRSKTNPFIVGYSARRRASMNMIRL